MLFSGVPAHLRPRFSSSGPRCWTHSLLAPPPPAGRRARPALDSGGDEPRPRGGAGSGGSTETWRGIRGTTGVPSHPRPCHRSPGAEPQGTRGSAPEGVQTALSCGVPAAPASYPGATWREEQIQGRECPAGAQSGLPPPVTTCSHPVPTQRRSPSALCTPTRSLPSRS